MQVKQRRRIAITGDKACIRSKYFLLNFLLYPYNFIPLLKLKHPIILEGMQPRSEVNLRTMSIAVAAGLIFCAVAETLGRKLFVSPMLLVSTLAVMAATLFPKAMGAISASGGIIGVLAMQVNDFLPRALNIVFLSVSQ